MIKTLLTLSIIIIELLSFYSGQTRAMTHTQNGSQCIDALYPKESQRSTSTKTYDPYWDLGVHNIGRFNIPVFEISEFNTNFEFGITDNPYHAIEITHERGTYLLVNTNKISAQSQIHQLVQKYLFEFIPKAYRSFEGERNIDESTIHSINATTRLIVDKLTLIVSLDKNDEINGGMAFITSLSSYEPLPLEREILDLIRKGNLQSGKVSDIFKFTRSSDHRIEGVRTYARSPIILKSLTYLSGKLLKNEKQKYPRTTILIALVSENSYALYKTVLKLHFTKVLKIRDFTGNEKVNVVGEIDIDQIPTCQKIQQ